MITKLIWKCKKCGDVQTSYSNRRHDMQMCKCGQSGVDLEEWYQRNIGSIEEVSREEIGYNTDNAK